MSTTSAAPEGGTLMLMPKSMPPTARRRPSRRRPPHCPPLDADEAGAISWVQPVIDHHVPDEVWCADRRTRPAKRIELHDSLTTLA